MSPLRLLRLIGLSKGIKPLSISGIAHLLGGRRDSLAEGPVMSLQEQARIIAVLCEHLMDVGEPLADVNEKLLQSTQDIESVPRSSNDTDQSSLSYASIRQSERRDPPGTPASEARDRVIYTAVSQ